MRRACCSVQRAAEMVCQRDRSRWEGGSDRKLLLLLFSGGHRALRYTASSSETASAACFSPGNITTVCKPADQVPYDPFCGPSVQVLAGAMRIRALVAAAVAKSDEARINMFLSAASHGDTDTVLQVQCCSSSRPSQGQECSEQSSSVAVLLRCQHSNWQRLSHIRCRSSRDCLNSPELENPA